GEGCQLCAPRPGSEVGNRLGGAYLLDGALDPHLPTRLRPVEEQRRARVLGELSALPALVVREEDEAALVDALQEHHPRRRGAVARRRRERHAISPALLEPGLELLER